MKRWLPLALVLVSSAAVGDGVEGWGRISLGGGFRWVPNWWFVDKAAAAGTPVIPGLSGGPQGTVSFGYGVNRWTEFAIDFLAGYHNFTLALPDGGRETYTSVSYGVVLGGRLVGTNFPFRGLMPYVAAQAGPLLSNISSPLTTVPEKVALSFSGAGGLTYRLGDRYGITLEARYVYGRSVVPGISGINVGGVWFGAMFTIFFPPSPKRDLELPSF